LAKKKHTHEKKQEIVSIKNIQNLALVEYLERIRGIPRYIASQYTKEVYYQREGKTYFWVGMKNESGGYEVRNKYFKTCLGNKDITIINPQKKSAEDVLVFEGFMDFLSYVVHEGGNYREDKHVILLNSVSLLDRAFKALKKLQATYIHCFLDNDTSGKKTLQRFQETYGNKRVIDHSKIYADFKDFNEFICKGKKDD